MKNLGDAKVFAGQSVAQNILIQNGMEQSAAPTPDWGTRIREALLQGNAAIMSNPNTTKAKKFGVARTLEDARDMFARITTGLRGA
jgi:hypothetical protein